MQMRKKAAKPLALCAAALCLAASLAGCAATADTAAATSAETTAASTTTETANATVQPGSDKPEGDYILTVDGYGVTEDEYLMFLRDQKAATANYYWVNYKMQPDNDFSLGTTYTYTITTGEETQELTQNTNSIGKADTVTEDLIYSYFVTMQPGESFDYDYYGTPAVVTLVSVQDEGTQSFEDAKDSLRIVILFR